MLTYVVTEYDIDEPGEPTILYAGQDLDEALCHPVCGGYKMLLSIWENGIEINPTSGARLLRGLPFTHKDWLSKFNNRTPLENFLRYIRYAGGMTIELWDMLGGMPTSAEIKKANYVHGYNNNGTLIERWIKC